MTDQHCIFTTWLKAQRGRDDAVGDLARDAAADRHWPKAAKSLPRLLDYLAGRGGRRGDCRRGLPAGLGGVPCRTPTFAHTKPTFAHGPRGQAGSKGTSSGKAVSDVGKRVAPAGGDGRRANRYFLADGRGQGHASQSRIETHILY